MSTSPLSPYNNAYVHDHSLLANTEKLKLFFNRYDMDSNGVLSQDEMNTVSNKARTELNEIIENGRGIYFNNEGKALDMNGSVIKGTDFSLLSDPQVMAIFSQAGNPETEAGLGVSDGGYSFFDVQTVFYKTFELNPRQGKNIIDLESNIEIVGDIAEQVVNGPWNEDLKQSFDKEALSQYLQTTYDPTALMADASIDSTTESTSDGSDPAAETPDSSPASGSKAEQTSRKPDTKALVNNENPALRFIHKATERAISVFSGKPNSSDER